MKLLFSMQIQPLEKDVTQQTITNMQMLIWKESNDQEGFQVVHFEVVFNKLKDVALYFVPDFIRHYVIDNCAQFKGDKDDNGILYYL